MRAETAEPAHRLKMVLPKALADSLCAEGTEGVEEIRVRAGRPVQLIYSDREKLLFDLVADMRLCEGLLDALCEHSVFARANELRAGYVTAYAACRVGVSGRAVWGRDGVERFASVTGFNIRIAREIKGCADAAVEELTSSGALRSAIVISPPGAGKTTLLRDAARSISNGAPGRRGYKVAVADERGELAGCSMGVPTLDVGLRTDVLDACPKSLAMEMLLRSMSPEVIVTDELGSFADAEAVMNAAAGGVAVIASAHGKNIADVRRRPYLASLIDGGYFERAIMLRREGTNMEAEITPLCAP